MYIYRSKCIRKPIQYSTSIPILPNHQNVITNPTDQFTSPLPNLTTQVGSSTMMIHAALAASYPPRKRQ